MSNSTCCGDWLELASTAQRGVLFKMKINVMGWELHLRVIKRRPNSRQPSYRHYIDSLCKVCADGDVGIVKDIVEKTRVNLSKEGRHRKGEVTVKVTPLCVGAISGHLSVVHYIYEYGADKKAGG